MRKLNDHCRKKARLGLKLGTANLELTKDAIKLHHNGVLDYFELYVIPGTFKQTVACWKKIGIPFVLHAPHVSHGVNLADATSAEQNTVAYEETRCFADELGAEIIIAHAGNGGTLAESIRQLGRINDLRIHIENKPMRGLNGKICQGYSPFEIKQILDSGVVGGFVLDFGHAVYSARSLGFSYLEHITAFLKLSPDMYHLSDGDLESEKDMHLNLGSGTFPLQMFIKMTGDNSMITLETPRRPECGLDDVVRDSNFIRNCLK